MESLKLGSNKSDRKTTKKKTIKRQLEVKNKLDALQESRRLAQELKDYIF